jgi:hypothetical protein
MPESRFGKLRCPTCGRTLPTADEECADCGATPMVRPAISMAPDRAKDVADRSDAETGSESSRPAAIDFDPDDPDAEAEETSETAHAYERPTEWVRVHDCANEMEALTLEAELAGHGILARVRPSQVTGYPGVGGSSKRRWGELLVDRADSLRATWMIREFLNSLGENDADEGSPDA